MFNNDIFEEWLDKKAKEIILEMGEGKALSSEDMMILVLKAQSNHFEHLDIELREDMKTLREDLTNDMKTLREDLTNDMKTLREDMTKELIAVREDMDKRFEQVDRRFEQVDKRFEQVDKRFEQVDKRFDQMVMRMDRFMVWSLGLTLSSTIFILGFIYKFMGH